MTDSPSTPNDWPKGALPERIIEWLFDQMLSKWGKGFVDKWSVVDPEKLKRDWAKALGNLSESEFRHGVAKMNGFDRPPSQPEFLKACRPDVNPLNAYYEALEGSRSRERGEVGTWSHPAIFWASVRVSAFELMNQSYSQIRARWESALALELSKHQWEPIEAPKLHIAGPANGQMFHKQAVDVMGRLKAATGRPTVSGDGKDWARNILKRQEIGDKTLQPIQIQFARQALQKLEKDDGNE